LRGKRGQSNNVPARSRKAGDEPVCNRITILRKDNGNRGRRFLGGTGCSRTTRDDDINLETHQFSRLRWQAIEFSLCISILNDNVFPFHVTKLAETLPERLVAGRVSGRGGTG